MARDRSAPDPFPAFRYTYEEVDEALRKGEKRKELEDYFGPETYQEMVSQARMPMPARSARTRGAFRPKVYILPGIMGSTLGTNGFFGTIWVSPIRIAKGDIFDLALDRDGKGDYESLEFLVFFYYLLRKRLERAGYEVVSAHYDWRLDLQEAADALVEQILADPVPHVALVGHSMGGLVARLAVKNKDVRKKVDRLVMIGTPNHGSFNAIGLFQGTHSLAQIVQRMDQVHNMDELLDKVFRTFPSVYQLLPFRSKYDAAELYDSGKWAGVSRKPVQKWLDRADEIAKTYPDPDPATHYLIAGVSEETVVSFTLETDNISLNSQAASGDGTVPLDSAMLPGVKVKFVEGDHMMLPTKESVAAAVLQVLGGDASQWTDDTGTRSRNRAPIRRYVPEILPPAATRNGKSAQPTAEEARLLFTSIGGKVPSRAGRTVAAVPFASRGRIAGLTIGQRPRRRLEIVLAKGDLTVAEAKVAVVGLFQNVQPGGAAASIDVLLSGAVLEMTNRGMFGAQAGQIFIMPTPTRRIGADMVLFAGLGPYDQLDEKMHRFAAANIVRSLVSCRVYEFSTVVFGANSRMEPLQALENLLCGILDGLADSDPEQRFRRVILCHRNSEKFEDIKNRVVELSIRGFFGDIEIVLDEIDMGNEDPSAEAARRTIEDRKPTTYLTVRANESGDFVRFDYSVLVSSGKATVFETSRTIRSQDLDGALAVFAKPEFDVDIAGADLAEILLPKELAGLLSSKEIADDHLTVINDPAATRIPWECLCIGKHIPAIAGGMSRMLARSGMSVSKWLDRRKADSTLTVLMVVNPTGDLPGAAEEGRAVLTLLQGIPRVSVTRLEGGEATRARLLKEFASGAFDAIHYSGHAHFVPDGVGQSGILAADGEVAGKDLAELSSLPSFVFFNACESGRVRRRGEPVVRNDAIATAVSFAESFLMNGIPQFLGTYWPVGDQSALEFAAEFYKLLVEGRSVGDALLSGRNAVRTKSRSKDWADYIHYGDPGFTLKSR